MEVYGELKRAQLENKTADHSVLVVGMIWWRSDLEQARFSDGTIATNLLANNAKCIFGNHATPANNIRFHRGSNGLLQFVTADDTTAEETLATSLAQLSFRTENYATVSLPAVGVAGRLAFDSSTSKLKVDTGISWETMEAGLPTGNKNYVLAENLTAGDLVGLSETGTLTQAYYSSASFGTGVDFYTTAIDGYSTCYDSVNNKVIACFIDDVTNFPMIMVGEIAGDGITYGAAVTVSGFASETISCCYDPFRERVVVAYTNGTGAGKTGLAVTATVLADTISAIGTPATFASKELGKIACCYDPTNKAVLIAFENLDATDAGFAIKGVVNSSGEIAFTGATPQNFSNINGAKSISCVFNSKLNQVMIAYAKQSAASTVTLVLAECSAVDPVIIQDSINITKGPGGSFSSVGITYDPNQDKTILSYSDAATLTGYLAAYDVLADGTSYELDEQTFSAVNPINNSMIFDTLNKKFALTYAEIGALTEGPGKILLGEVIDNKLSFGTGVQFIANVESAVYGNQTSCLVFDEHRGRYCVFFHDDDDSDLCKSTVLRPLTPYQMIGILNTTGLLGETKDVSLMGAISGTVVGKTPGSKAYVQPDLTIDYKKTNYPIGQFISATELLLGRGE